MNRPRKKPPAAESFPLIDREAAHAAEKPELDKGAVFLLDKPQGWTSFRVVGLLRKLCGIKKVGHAGTLDPMATGLLILCCARATKSISQLQDTTKEYLAELQFGATTPSFDAETPADSTMPFSHITEKAIREMLASDFKGEIQQTPPMYSALRVKGERLYHLARKGETVEREARAVTIEESELTSYNPETGKACIRIVCTKGTYIRTIADDLGRKLSSGAHLTGLRRTRSGSHSVENAMNMQELLAYFNADDDINLS